MGVRYHIDCRWFDRFIMVCILLNSVTLGIYDYSDRDNTTNYNKVIDIIGNGFSLIFLIEALLKVLSQGFVISSKSYLRDSWNVLDFLIVLSR